MSEFKYFVQGQGPAVAFLHGWGSNSKIWQELVSSLSNNFQLWCIDLPGHGDNHPLQWDGSDKHAISVLAQILPKQCSMIGWSLGGLLAQCYASHYPERIKNLMLISSIPKFTQSTNWSHGMSINSFNEFKNSFKTQPIPTLKQFYALQVVNTKDGKNTLAVLLRSLDESNDIYSKVAWGLDWLERIDLRENTVLRNMNIDLLAGDMDQVVSINAIHQTAQYWDKIKVIEVTGAGHAPFVSHPQVVIDRICNW